MKFITKICQADVPNKNGRTYPRELLEGLTKTKPDEVILGHLGMDAGRGAFVDMHRVSHTVSSMRIDEEGYLVCAVTVLDTPNGKILKDLLEAPLSDISFRTAGFATIDKDGIISNFKLISINAVSEGA
jgi:hypothetical protein